MARKEKIEKLVKCLDEVMHSVAFRRNGFTIDIRDNNTIVLTANNIKGPYAEKLTKQDSEELLGLMSIALKDLTDEESQDYNSDQDD